MPAKSYLIIALWSIFQSATSFSQTVLKGELTDLEGWKPVLYLSYLNHYKDFISGSDGLVIDSAEISPSGHFAFPPLLYQQGWYRLNIQPFGSPIMAGMQVGVPFENYIHFFLTPDDLEVSLRASAAKLHFSYLLTESNQESKLAQTIRDIRLPLFDILKTASDLSQNFGALLPEQQAQLRDSIFNILDPAARKMQGELRIFIDSTSNVNAGVLATKYYNLGDDYSQYAWYFDRMLQKWTSTQPNNRYLAGLRAEVEFFHSHLPVGAPAPDIHLPDFDDQIQRLSELNAKLIIIDFWASWCGPCRIENRETVLPLYSKFKDNGLEIFAVSLDTNKKKWRQAVEKDNYTWIQVSDLKGQENSEVAALYKISAVPTTYLLDEHKRIIAKDLRGNDLVRFVQQYLDQH